MSNVSDRTLTKHSAPTGTHVASLPSLFLSSLLDPPVCKSESTIIRAALKQTINITCEVDANPLDNLNYKWHFNNSLESLIELPQVAQLVQPATLPLQFLASGSGLGGYYQRSKRKHTHGTQRLLHGRHGRVASIVDMSAALRFEDEYEHEHEHEHEQEELLHESFDHYPDYMEPQMVYSNMVHKNHVENKQPQRKQQQQQQLQQHQQQQQQMHQSESSGSQLAERKRLAALHKQQHHRQLLVTPTTTATPPLNNVYSYHVESYESFGAISCIANSPMGHSQPCWYHIQPAGECHRIS